MKWFLTDFIPVFFFPNTLQTPINSVDSTPFKQPSKSSLFSLKKWTKKINRDFIKGGRGSPFYEMISQKIFFSRMMASLVCDLSFTSMLIFFKNACTCRFLPWLSHPCSDLHSLILASSQQRHPLLPGVLHVHEQCSPTGNRSQMFTSLFSMYNFN